MLVYIYLNIHMYISIDSYMSASTPEFTLTMYMYTNIHVCIYSYVTASTHYTCIYTVYIYIICTFVSRLVYTPIFTFLFVCGLQNSFKEYSRGTEAALAFGLEFVHLPFFG